MARANNCAGLVVLQPELQRSCSAQWQWAGWSPTPRRVSFGGGSEHGRHGRAVCQAVFQAVLLLDARRWCCINETCSGQPGSSQQPEQPTSPVSDGEPGPPAVQRAVLRPTASGALEPIPGAQSLAPPALLGGQAASARRCLSRRLRIDAEPAVAKLSRVPALRPATTCPATTCSATTCLATRCSAPAIVSTTRTDSENASRRLANDAATLP